MFSNISVKGVWEAEPGKHLEDVESPKDSQHQRCRIPGCGRQSWNFSWAFLAGANHSQMQHLDYSPGLLIPVRSVIPPRTCPGNK